MKKLLIISLLSSMVLITATGCSGAPSAEKSQTETSAIVSSVLSVPSAAEESETSKGITALYVSPDSCKLKISEKRLLSVSSDKGTQLSSDLVWVCDDESIATVDSSGNVIGKAPGDCVITVSRRDQPSVTAKVSITVKPNEESSTVPDSSVQSSQSQASTEETTSQSSSNNNEGNTAVIEVILPSGSVSYPVPSQYTYYYGRNNFSYSNPADGYVIYSMLNHYLTRQELSRITDSDAQMMLNTLYARNGYIFNSKDIQNYFETQTWYNAIPYSRKSGNMSKVVANFDSMDRANCDLLVAKRDGKI